MSPPRGKFSLRAVRWLAPAAALALAPKCVLCALAYAGLASALGLGGRELCGAPAASPAWWLLLAPATAAIASAGFCIRRFRRPPRSDAHGCRV